MASKSSQHTDSDAQSKTAVQRWWHDANVYEIYPASFKDSNGDGWGDIPGIISKAPYLKQLCIDVVWLAACYKSGGVDMGYDVVDYTDVDAKYGTVKDIERLIETLDDWDCKLIMDLVVNHTSDQHPWFQESRSSRESEKRDWYFWRKGRILTLSDGSQIRAPPNNWASIFGGSAWTYDHNTDEYYLHMFASQQPDLNWENEHVRQAVYEVMHFWLKKRVAGFRMDVINMLSKQPGLPDAAIVNTETFEQPALHLCCDGPRIHEYLREMREKVLDQYCGFDDYWGARMTVGEIIVTNDPETIKLYTNPERRELDMAYQYSLFEIGSSGKGKFIPRDPPWTQEELNLKLKTLINKWQTALAWPKGSWGTIWLESHDSARCVTRFGDCSDENRDKVAKMLGLLQATLGGTLFVYQGQELGLKNLTENVPFKDYKDVETIRGYFGELEKRHRNTGAPRDKIDMSDVLRQIRMKARDHARNPLPWTVPGPDNPTAGFSTNPDGTDAVDVKVWSPMNTDTHLYNVDFEAHAGDSVLEFYRDILRFRKCHPETLVFGDFEALEKTMDNGPVFAYIRRPVSGHKPDMLIALNLTDQEGIPFRLPEFPGQAADSAYERSDRFPLIYNNSQKYQWVVLRNTRGKDRRMLEVGTRLFLEAYEGLVLVPCPQRGVSDCE